MKRANSLSPGNDRIISVDFSKGNQYNADREKEQNSIGKKLETAREQLGLSRADLRALIGSYGVNLHRDIIRRWEVGETIPTCYQFIALCQALKIDDCLAFFSDIPQQLNETGLRKVAEYKKDLIASGLYTPTVTEIEYIEMPVSYLSASAGPGSLLDEGSYEMVSVPKSSVPKGAETGIRVSGDSMEPVYKDGQLVWARYTRELQPGDEGIFTYDGKGYIKCFGLREPPEEYRDSFTDMDGGLILQPVLKSYNKKYDPIFVTPDKHFEIVAKVLH